MILNISSKKRKRGRPPLPADERARRKEEQKIRYREKGEARRRALAILRERHEAEFQSLLEEQMAHSGGSGHSNLDR